jgi:hypothetical protein
VYIYRKWPIFGDFPAKNTVYTPYIYGSGQPYVYDTIDRGILNIGSHEMLGAYYPYTV